MSNFKVFVDRIHLFDHPNAERLTLGKIGSFQLVCQKETYRDGDLVVFAPFRAVLPDDLRSDYVNTDTGASYLKGSDHDRVGSIRLRGELSEGVTINPRWVMEKLGVLCLEDIPLNKDISERLDIVEWTPPIPTHLSGQIVNICDLPGKWIQHDVEQYGIYKDQFVANEKVVVTQKIHGSQMHAIVVGDQCYITSKGIGRVPQSIVEDEGNLYWQAAKNTNLFVLLKEAQQLSSGLTIHAFGEAFPCQGGSWTYGVSKPTLRLFRLVVDGVEYSVDQVKEQFHDLFALWVPVLYSEMFDEVKFYELAKLKEQVSGKELHIGEGIVITPRVPRLAKDGTFLAVKLLNPKYKESDEDIS